MRSSLQRNTEGESTDNIIMQNNITDSVNLNTNKHIFFAANEFLIERIRYQQPVVFPKDEYTWKTD